MTMADTIIHPYTDGGHEAVPKGHKLRTTTGDNELLGAFVVRAQIRND